MTSIISLGNQNVAKVFRKGLIIAFAKMTGFRSFSFDSWKQVRSSNREGTFVYGFVILAI
jgi:hypothetical protein